MKKIYPLNFVKMVKHPYKHIESQKFQPQNLSKWPNSPLKHIKCAKMADKNRLNCKTISSQFRLNGQNALKQPIESLNIQPQNP